MPTLEEKKEQVEEVWRDYIYNGYDGTYTSGEGMYPPLDSQRLMLDIGAKAGNFKTPEGMGAYIQRLESQSASAFYREELAVVNKMKGKILENSVNPLLDRFPSFGEFTVTGLNMIARRLPTTTWDFLEKNTVELEAHFNREPRLGEVHNNIYSRMYAELYIRKEICKHRTISAPIRTTLSKFLHKSGTDISANPTYEALGWGISARDAYALFNDCLNNHPKAKFYLAGYLSPASNQLYVSL
jgi:hypothetical protein